MTLSNKEEMLIKDLMAAEKLSIDKYIKSSSEAKELGLKNLFSDGDTFNAVFYSTMQPTVNTASLFNTTITGIRTETRLRQKVFPAGLNLVTSVEDVTTGETVDGTYTLPVGYTSIPIPKEAMTNGAYYGDEPVVHTTFILSYPASWSNRFLKFSHLMDNVRARGLLLPMYLFLND